MQWITWAQHESEDCPSAAGEDSVRQAMGGGAGKESVLSPEAGWESMRP